MIFWFETLTISDLKFSLLIVALVCLVIIVLSYFLSEKLFNKEKTSVYECGFSPIKHPNNPFSIKFFLVGILFLVFDLEIVLLFPWSLYFTQSILVTNIMFYVFFTGLILGLGFEWFAGGLEWE